VNKEKMKELSSKIFNEVKNYTSNRESLKDYIKYINIFPEYSNRNIALIKNQFKNATALASEKEWVEMGYSINKDEQGIKILKYVPTTYFTDKSGTEKSIRAATINERIAVQEKKLKSRKVHTFKVGHVYDVSQTNANAKNIKKIFPFKQFEFQVTDKNLLALNKGLSGLAHKYDIPFNSSLDAQKLIKGIEQITRSILDKDFSARNSKEIDSSKKDLQVGLATHIVCQHYGIKTELESIPGLSKWLQHEYSVDEKERDLTNSFDISKKIVRNIDREILLEREREVNLNFKHEKIIPENKTFKQNKIFEIGKSLSNELGLER